MTVSGRPGCAFKFGEALSNSDLLICPHLTVSLSRRRRRSGMLRVITGGGGRRRRSDDEKARAIEASLVPGAVVPAVARRPRTHAVAIVQVAPRRGRKLRKRQKRGPSCRRLWKLATRVIRHQDRRCRIQSPRDGILIPTYMGILVGMSGFAAALCSEVYGMCVAFALLPALGAMAAAVVVLVVVGLKLAVMGRFRP
jgi:hypothetical protein